MITQVIMNEKQKLLLRFQKRNMIDSNSSSSDSDINTQDYFKYMNHKNQIVRHGIKGKILESL
jgi:hypothetical protein